jgi:hypothetical protein
MKKPTLLMALALLAGSIALSPTTANAQDEKQAEAERTWYDSCVTKKDERCIPLSKELFEKYPASQYAKFAKQKIENDSLSKAWERFQAALKAYYTPPQDGNKLEALFAAGEGYLKLQPGQQYVIGQMALAGANGALGQIYKNLDKVKSHAETALKVFEPAAPPEGWKPEEWNPLREIVLAQMNQYMGWHLIETKGDQEQALDQALDYLTKATQVRGKDGAGWKDPNNFWLRSSVYSKKYVALRAEYDKLTDEQKTGDQGKEILKKVNDLLDTKLIPEYARVLATATKPEAKGLYDAAKPQFDAFWKYRTDAPDKAADYVKNFTSDPTVAAPPIPVKVETAENLTAPAAPVGGPGNVKLTAGATGAAPAGATKNGNGKNVKAAPAKGKPSPKRKRKG